MTTVDAANEVKVPGTNAPIGNPGASKTYPFDMVLDGSKARRQLDMEFRDMLTTTRDTLEDYKARGWM